MLWSYYLPYGYSNVRKPQVARVPHPVRPSRSVIRRNALPVKRYRDDIVCCVAENKVVCIEGETGSGKSSMIPQFILDDCIESCKILVSQPNPITAIKLAERVSHNLREDVGKTVGYGIDSEHYEIVSTYQVSFNLSTSARSLIIRCVIIDNYVYACCDREQMLTLY